MDDAVQTFTVPFGIGEVRGVSSGILRVAISVFLPLKTVLVSILLSEKGRSVTEKTENVSPVPSRRSSRKSLNCTLPLVLPPLLRKSADTSILLTGFSGTNMPFASSQPCVPGRKSVCRPHTTEPSL